MLTRQLADIRPSHFRQDKINPASEGDGVTDGWFEFETDVARGYGHVRLKNGLIWTLLTTMTELKGHEEPKGPMRPMGAEHGSDPSRKTWKEKREQEAAELGHTTQPYVVIVGGGQGGIALGARLRQLGVPAIIIEKNERPGDRWRNRYRSLCLHDPVWYDHLPYLPFPDHWPVFAPKDKIGDWLEMYTKVMELNYWHSTTCKSRQISMKRKRNGRLIVERGGKEIELRPKQLVLATGMSGKAEHSKIQGSRYLQGRTTALSAASRARCLKAKKWSCSAPTTPRMISARHFGKQEPMSPCCSAQRPIS